MRTARTIAVATVLSLTCGVLAFWPATAVAQPPAPGPDPSAAAAAAAERDLRSQSAGAVTVRRDDRGTVRFVGAESGKPVRRLAGIQSASPARAAAAHLQRYGALWGLQNDGVDVVATDAHRAAGNDSVVRFQQTIDGVPVFGGELAVSLDPSGNLESINGETTPLAPAGDKLTVTAARAQQAAIAVTARAHHLARSGLLASEAEPFLYDPALLGPGGKTGLTPVWRVEVTGPAHVRQVVLVDRVRGGIALQYNQIAHADRVVCDRSNVRDTLTNGQPTLASCTTSGAARSEGGTPSAVAEVNDAYEHIGDTADFFASQLGVDLTALIGSTGADGRKIRATVRYCLPTTFDPSCPMANAFWNGNGIYLGNGFARADDVVAHELAHGVTERTANLSYWYQSGAISESMSDVFGELVDLTNNRDAGPSRPWLLGEDAPTGALRSMADPGVYDAPDRMTSPYYHAPTWSQNDFDNGGVHDNSGVGNKAAYLISEPGTRTFNGQTISGLGYTKAAKIYYRALTMLTSGADYLDLYGVLPQACTNLVGSGAVSSADCAEVSKAVTATEMNKDPVSADAKAPEAPVGCTTSAKRDLFLDTFERDTLGTNWSVTSGMWGLATGYAKGGTRSLYGLEPDRALGEPSNTYARITKSFLVPSGVRTYLRFDHNFLLAYWPGDSMYPQREHWAGGRVEYSTDGKTWLSAMSLPWDSSGVVPRTINPYNTDGTPAATYRGFGGDTHGYAASRLDLSSLAGKSVQLRWRITADPQVFLDGWNLDNVNLYACGSGAPSEPRSYTGTGAPGTATLKWTAPLWPGNGGLTKYKLTITSVSSTRTIDNISPTATSRVVTGLANSGYSYTFKLTPYSAAGAGPSVSKRLVGGRISVTASPTTINRGGSTKISGKVVRSDNGVAYKGWAIRLEGRRKGTSTWSLVATGYTGTGGAYSFTRRPVASWEYRVVYRSGNSSYLGSISPSRTVTVR
ncbi:M4 family metallopeptidase [Saccharomonospora sp. NPDC046836]|uniref:M4 family metallopeptidase n=1 Tax=Saccharomonospora sp. NPDC046836 TaxID=3156921 RepID=UPI0034021D09